MATEPCYYAANQRQTTRKFLQPVIAGFVQLSILLPTNRSGPVALSRIAQACSWAGPEIQVVIRDNSGNAEKRELLNHLRREHCDIVSVDPCEPLENYSEIMRLAKGDFIFCMSDDDQCVDRAIRALPGLIDQVGQDASVAAINGSYALETQQGTSIINYKDLDSDDPSVRVAGYLGFPGPNMLFYSVLRRELAERVLFFMKAMPVYLSFHDQILCLLYLLSGKFVSMPRLFYVYDIGVWEKAESAQKRDLDFYTAAGLDPAVNQLHWLLCAFEGAVLIMNSDFFPNYPAQKRQPIADRWFSAMYARFKGGGRLTYGSPLADDAEKLCARLRTATGQLTFQNVLSDICGLMSLSSKSQAQKYFDFWNSTLNKHQPDLRKTGS